MPSVDPAPNTSEHETTSATRDEGQPDAPTHRVWPGDPRRGEIQVCAEHAAWSNDHARLLVASVRLPADARGRTADGEMFRLVPGEGKGDGVVIAAIGEDDRLLLVHQFRHPVRLWLRELPRGAREEGETPDDTARREVGEELGCEIRELHPLGRIAADSGQVGSVPYLMAARVRPADAPHRERSESIDRVVRLRYSELRAACERGEVLDGFTLAAVLRLAPHFQGDHFVWDDAAAPVVPPLGEGEERR